MFWTYCVLQNPSMHGEHVWAKDCKLFLPEHSPCLPAFLHTFLSGIQNLLITTCCTETKYLVKSHKWQHPFQLNIYLVVKFMYGMFITYLNLPSSMLSIKFL